MLCDMSMDGWVQGNGCCHLLTINAAFHYENSHGASKRRVLQTTHDTLEEI